MTTIVITRREITQNVIKKPVTVNVQGRGLMGFKGDKGDPGNLTGPASSVDENIPIFDGITGDKLKDSGVKLSDKADVTAVTAGLLLKADITSLEIEKKLLMDEIDSLKKSAIENSNAPYLTVSDYGDVVLAKNSVGVGTMGIDGVTVENELDFSGGLSDWIGYYGTLSISGGKILFHSTTTSTAARIETKVNKIYLNKEIVYVFLDITSPKACAVQCKLGGTYSRAEQIQVGVKTSLRYRVESQGTAEPLRIYLDGRTSVLEVGDVVTIENLVTINLTTQGLASLTEAQLAKLLPVYFNGEKTFGGVGCLVSKDSADAETGRMYFETTPMYSNATLRDILTYSEGKYYHTHNVDSDGVAIADPYDTEVETNGQFLALSEGTMTYEPWYPDIAVYTDKFTLTKAITAVKELYKYGSETLITDAVIAGDGLSFTSASLTAGDLVYGVFEFDEPLRPLMTVKSRNDDATIADTANGKVYTFRPVITNGAIASWELTEV